MAASRIPGKSNASELLGGTRVLGSAREPIELQRAIRAGLPYAALEAFEDRLGLAHRDLVEVLGVAPRTLARRRHHRRLSPLESDRLYRLAHLTERAIQTLGSAETARVWLGRPNRALGGRTPLSILDTEIGVRQLEEVLVRIDFGTYA